MNPIILYHMQRACHILGIDPATVCIVTDKTCPPIYRAIRQDALESGMIGAYWHDPITNRHMVYVDTTTGRVAETVAHELRHVWQAITGTLGVYDHSLPYSDNPHEHDAVAWSMAYCDSL